LLAAILLEGEGLAARQLVRFKVDLDTVRRRIPMGTALAEAGQLPFSPRIKRAMELAAECSSTLGHDVIGSEHLLLGLIEEGEGEAHRILSECIEDLPRLRQAVLDEIIEKVVPNSDRVQSVLRDAFAEAIQLKSSRVEPEHLILAIMADGGPGARLLSRSGITREAVIETIRLT
jgi:ATP-dependent Clp protease ATP-binding subunit ClpA